MFVAKLLRILKVSSDKGYVEVMPGSEVSDKFGTTIQDLRKLHGLNSCILEFEIKTLNIESGKGKLIETYSDDSGEKCYKIDISDNKILLDNFKEHDQDEVEAEDESKNQSVKPEPTKTLIARDRKGTLKCPSVLGDLTVTSVVKVCFVQTHELFYSFKTQKFLCFFFFFLFLIFLISLKNTQRCQSRTSCRRSL